jgi:toxin secretion/phage lysis holin
MAFMDKISGTLIISFIALIGSVTGSLMGLFGGWDSLFKILMTLVIIDYLSGFISSAAEGGLSSSIGFKGIAKKIFIFVLIAVSHMIDQELDHFVLHCE